jgi:hypothetical protein
MSAPLVDPALAGWEAAGLALATVLGLEAFVTGIT